MTTFILVHGGMHGGWCWDAVVPRLKRAGHEVQAPNLPGMAADHIPPQDISLDMTADFIADLARRQSEKIVLVGHSLGGITISGAAERAPDAIAGLVYVAAFLLPDGASAMDNLAFDMVAGGVQLSADGATLTIDPEQARERFYSGCEESVARQALARLVPQPTRPMGERLRLTPDRFGIVPRAYVECLHDNAHPLHLQRSHQAALPCEPVFTMDTGHSPFLQAPEAFTDHLIAAAQAFERRR